MLTLSTHTLSNKGVGTVSTADAAAIVSSINLDALMDFAFSPPHRVTPVHIFNLAMKSLRTKLSQFLMKLSPMENGMDQF